MNKDLYSVYCPCIDDMVKFIECKSCVNVKDEKCQYQKEFADSNHKETKEG